MHADAEAAMAELEALMRSIATGALPHRGEATAYSRHRADLLGAAGDAPLPGFVRQCLTVFKFRDFIQLYDPDPALRESFVRRSFDRCRADDDGDARPIAAAAGAGPPQRWRF